MFTRCNTHSGTCLEPLTSLWEIFITYCHIDSSYIVCVTISQHIVITKSALTVCTVARCQDTAHAFKWWIVNALACKELLFHNVLATKTRVSDKKQDVIPSIVGVLPFPLSVTCFKNTFLNFVDVFTASVSKLLPPPNDA